MFHVNPETGDAGACRAKQGKCPFGNADEHYTTAEAARTAYETNQELQAQALVIKAEEEKEARQAVELYKEYGPDSTVFKPWGKIHRDFKSTLANGQKSALTLDSKGSTVLAPWQGPKVLKLAEESLAHVKTYDKSWEDIMAKDNSYQASTEPLSSVLMRQAVVTDNLQKLKDEFGDDVKVDVLTRRTPFGNFLAAVVKSEN